MKKLMEILRLVYDDACGCRNCERICDILDGDTPGFHVFVLPRAMSDHNEKDEFVVIKKPKNGDSE